jgi:hypothetical protein
MEIISEAPSVNEMTSHVAENALYNKILNNKFAANRFSLAKKIMEEMKNIKANE